MGAESRLVSELASKARAYWERLTCRHVVAYKCVECGMSHAVRFRTARAALDAATTPTIYTGCKCNSTLLPEPWASREIERRKDEKARLREALLAQPGVQHHLEMERRARELRENGRKLGPVVHVIDGKSYPS